MSNKRKWKVYTHEELRDRFQAKPGGQAGMDDSKMAVPNLKRRNSAPPGMIHFPPGTFSAQHSPQNSHSSHPSHPGYQPSSPHQQHELVTHARNSPTNKHAHAFADTTTNNTTKRGDHLYAADKSHPYSSARHSQRRASLPFIPSSSSSSLGPPSIEAYLTHLQNMPLATHDHDEDGDEELDELPPLSPTQQQQTLPSFQSLLKTIHENMDEEEPELRDIADRANGSPHMQTSKTLPVYMSPKQTHTFPFPNPPQEPSSPSSKFYKNNLSRSNENLPSLSRMSISDIIS